MSKPIPSEVWQAVEMSIAETSRAISNTKDCIKTLERIRDNSDNPAHPAFEEIRTEVARVEAMQKRRAIMHRWLKDNQPK